MKTEEVAAEESIEEAAPEMAPTIPVQLPVMDSLLMSYERTPCFGRCPIFKIRLYESGYVTYEGINFVDHMGYFDARVGKDKVDRILLKFDEIGFFELEDRYDDERLMDLPSRIFVLDLPGKNKRVVARYQAPESLNDLAMFIENEFKNTEWEPVTHDH